MPADPTEFKNCVGRRLESAGFVRRSDSWYLRTDETILVINLQRSQWSRLYYLNLAIWLNALGAQTWPKENHCPIGLRLDDLVSEPAEAKRSMDLEDESMSWEDRCAYLQSVLDSTVVPFMKRCGTLAGIQEEVRLGRLRGARMFKTARALLGLEQG